MSDTGDWRLTGQERFLTGVTLRWSAWHPPRPGWDHDHCEFCWAKFTEGPQPGTLAAGYSTDDGYRWVCPTCFADFRERFAWRLVEGDDPSG